MNLAEGQEAIISFCGAPRVQDRPFATDVLLLLGGSVEALSAAQAEHKLTELFTKAAAFLPSNQWGAAEPAEASAVVERQVRSLVAVFALDKHQWVPLPFDHCSCMFVAADDPQGVGPGHSTSRRGGS